jgi:hypothetical protein
MTDNLSYNIHVLGLKDASKAGRQRFVGTLERLTGRPRSEFEEEFPSPHIPVFQSLDLSRAKKMLESLDSNGILVEVRPTDSPAINAEEEVEAGKRACPACNAHQSASNIECQRCGIVFSKYEREQLLKMQKDHTLEQAMIKAMQIREEWLQRATKFLEGKPLPKDAAKVFSTILLQDEVPFLRLESAEGPILLTSRRMLTKNSDGKFISMPYEMMSEVDFGGGAIQTKKSKFRVNVKFHSPLPVGAEENIAKMSWNLDKESSFSKEVVMDWGYARNFICGSCGERDLDFRTDGAKVHCRCMHCATDHEVDLGESVAVPLLSE